MRWFTADLHLGHANIIRYCNRPFADVEEMNEELVRRWNARVTPNDEVWVLGDFALGRIAESFACGRRLNGRKSLVVGNHDRMFGARRAAEYRRWVERYQQEAGFDDVVDNVSTRIGEIPVRLSHFPYEGDSHDRDRFVHARPRDDGGWLVHGHVHEKWKVNGRQVNVGVDVWNFAPVAEHELALIMRPGRTGRARHVTGSARSRPA